MYKRWTQQRYSYGPPLHPVERWDLAMPPMFARNQCRSFLPVHCLDLKVIMLSMALRPWKAAGRLVDFVSFGWFCRHFLTNLGVNNAALQENSRRAIQLLCAAGTPWRGMLYLRAHCNAYWHESFRDGLDMTRFRCKSREVSVSRVFQVSRGILKEGRLSDRICWKKRLSCSDLLRSSITFRGNE